MASARTEPGRGRGRSRRGGGTLSGYPAIRRFLPTFLTAFRFRTTRACDPVLSTIELLCNLYANGCTILPRKASVWFLKPKWRRIVMPPDGAFNRRAWGIAVLVHLCDRLA